MIGVILVKGISKRLPGKNFLNFDGKPLWRINVDKIKDKVDAVWVITDSVSHDKIEEYDNVKKWQRPTLYESGVLGDEDVKYTSSCAVVRRFVEEMYLKKDPNPMLSLYGYTIGDVDIMLVQATNPLITDKFIDNCITAYNGLEDKTLVSINQNTCKVNGNIYIFSSNVAWHRFRNNRLINTRTTLAYVGTYPTINADIDIWDDYCIAIAIGEGRIVNVQ